MKIQLFYSYTVFVILCIVGCSPTRYVPQGKYLLDKVSIKSDVKGIRSTDLVPYVKQHPNYKTLGIYKLPLHLYSLSGEDSSRFYNRWLKGMGEAPVLFDSVRMIQTSEELRRVFVNKGYVNAQVKALPQFGANRVDVDYLIRANAPFVVSNYQISLPDSAINFDNNPPSEEAVATDPSMPPYKLINGDVLLEHTLISSGMLFDLDVLDAERTRVASLLRSNGYYSITKERIGFVADTLNTGKNEVALEMVLSPIAIRKEGKIHYLPHKKFTINRVDIFLEYDPLISRDFNDYLATDSLLVENCHVWLGSLGLYIRPKVLAESVYLRPGMAYDQNLSEMTYNALSRLNIVRNVSIQFVPDAEQEEALRAIITCLPEKRQGFAFEVEGTNTTGMFGIASSLSYRHRNIFRGGEWLNLKLQASFDALSSRSSVDNNFYEIGTEALLSFPRMLSPFLSKEFKRRSKATTQISSTYSYQQYPSYYRRSIVGVGVKYIWQDQRNRLSRQTLDLLDVSYVHFPYLSQTFYSSLSEYSKVYSFQSQFIASIGYSYSYSNLSPTDRSIKPVYTFRGAVETAGNALSLASTLMGKKTNSRGLRQILGIPYAQYVKGNVDYGKTYFIDLKNSVAWHVGLGVAVPYGNSRIIPIQKRFFSGGGNSVRGWNARELGPGTYSADSTSSFFFHAGDVRLDANIEYRSKVFWRLELAAFLDAGNVWTIRNYDEQTGGVFRAKSFYKQIAWAWGLGFRFDFDVVLARLDFGWKLYDPISKHNQSKWQVLRPWDLSNNMAWHIAVGYPF